MRTLWLSSQRMTVIAYLDERGIIVRTAPVTRKFVGQHVSHLELWMGRQGNLRIARLDDERDPGHTVPHESHPARGGADHG